MAWPLRSPWRKTVELNAGEQTTIEIDLDNAAASALELVPSRLNIGVRASMMP